MRCRISLQLSDAPLEIGRRREAAAWTLIRFLGRSTPSSEFMLGSVGSEVMGRLVPVLSLERSDGVSSAELEALLSAGSQAESPEFVCFRESEVIFFRQDA